MAVDVGQIHEAARLRRVNKRSAKRALNKALRAAESHERRFVRTLYRAARSADSRTGKPDPGAGGS